MNRYLLLFLAAFLLSFYDGSKIDFIQNNIPAAQDKAAREGKLTVVAFGAAWCQPCLFMDENTWANPEVASYMNDHCIGVKIDVDDYRGQVYRDQYAIRYYPSVLIFNSKGDLLHKHEGLLGAESMVGLLQTYASKENESLVNARPADRGPRMENPFAEPEAQITERPHELPPAYQEQPADDRSSIKKRPSDEATTEEGTGYEATRGRVNTNPRTLRDKSRRVPATPVEPSVATSPRKDRPADKPALAAVPKAKAKTAPPARSNQKSARTTPNLSKKAPKGGFTVQVGVYAAKVSAAKEAEKVAKKFGKKGSAIESSLKGKRVYRGVVGEFSSKADALSFRQKVEKAGFQSLVKAWSELR